MLRGSAPVSGRELYDLSKDLGEEKNIAAEHPQVVAKIEAYLKTARTDHPDWPINPAPRGGPAAGKAKAGKAKAP
jgi:hypothetical protein